MYPLIRYGNKEKCPFCNADTEINSDADKIESTRYYHGKNWKKAKFHLEAAAMAGHEEARNNIGRSIIRTELLSIGSFLHLLGHIQCHECLEVML
jgi:hypothetical protein